MKVENLRTVRQMAESTPIFTEAYLRWLIFNASQNGLDRALGANTDAGSRADAALMGNDGVTAANAYSLNRTGMYAPITVAAALLGCVCV